MSKLNLYGNDLFGDSIQPPSRGKVADKFTIPPFSVLSARDGFWQTRKRMWRAFGIEGEVGRDAPSIHCPTKKYSNPTGRNQNLTYTGASASFDYYRLQEGKKTSSHVNSTSIFDPVLTELIYNWFCPKNGQIVDPFAGGSVRGIVANLLGFKYWGSELRQEQIDANIQQGKDICEDQPVWICGDSIDTLEDAPEADFVFSCPPYGDLEQYSDNPCDLSNMEYHTFVAAYNRIILRACKKLKQDRFACFVVGDFRDKRGYLRNFISDTINAFREQKLELYNEAILITSVGSGSMRVTKQFNASRKLVKTHQNILVFVKGNPKKATEYLDFCEQKKVLDEL